MDIQLGNAGKVHALLQRRAFTRDLRADVRRDGRRRRRGRRGRRQIQRTHPFAEVRVHRLSAKSILSRRPLRHGSHADGRAGCVGSGGTGGVVAGQRVGVEREVFHGKVRGLDASPRALRALAHLEVHGGRRDVDVVVRRRGPSRRQMPRRRRIRRSWGTIRRRPSSSRRSRPGAASPRRARAGPPRSSRRPRGTCPPPRRPYP